MFNHTKYCLNQKSYYCKDINNSLPNLSTIVMYNPGVIPGIGHGISSNVGSGFGSRVGPKVEEP